MRALKRARRAVKVTGEHDVMVYPVILLDQSHPVICFNVYQRKRAALKEEMGGSR